MKYIKLFESFDEYDLDEMSIMELLDLIKEQDNDDNKYDIMKYIYENRKNDIIGKLVIIDILKSKGSNVLTIRGRKSKICIDVKLKEYDKKNFGANIFLGKYIMISHPQLVIYFNDGSVYSEQAIVNIIDLSELNTKELVDLIKKYPKYFEDKKEYEDLLDAIKIGMI